MPYFVFLFLLFICFQGCDDKKNNSTPAINGPVEFYGQLEAKGNAIVGSITKNVVQVKGISFFWSNWSDSFWTAAMVDRSVDDFKAEVIRAAFGVDDNGTPQNGSSYEQVYRLVDRAIERDIYVIIDWHSHGAHKNTAAAKAFFSTMAQKYGENDHVIFELFNEPLQISWATIKAYAEEIIPVIREHSDNLIIVGTPTWSQDINLAADNPINDLNIAYTYHFYVPNHGTSLAQKLPYALSKNVAVFGTEWGVWEQESWCECNYSLEEWMTLLDKHSISWCKWSLFDKDEKSSLINPNQGPNGSLSENGLWLKTHLQTHAQQAEWRK
jgi:endoglucanase